MKKLIDALMPIKPIMIAETAGECRVCGQEVGLIGRNRAQSHMGDSRAMECSGSGRRVRRLMSKPNDIQPIENQQFIAEWVST